MTISGVSVSGLGTRLRTPIGLTFDIGVCTPDDVPKTNLVAITHGHMDHVGQAPYLAAVRALRGLSEPNFILPWFLVDRFNDMMDRAGSLDETPLRYGYTAIGPGDVIEFPKGTVSGLHERGPREKYYLEALEADHVVPALSYVVWRETKRIKAEYQGLKPEDYRSMKDRGVDFNEFVRKPVFAYTGDTRISVFDKNPVLYEVQHLAMEVTYYNDVPREQARERGHIHIQDVVERADLFKNEEVLIVHRSARYKWGEHMTASARALRTFKPRVLVLQ